MVTKYSTASHDLMGILVQSKPIHSLFRKLLIKNATPAANICQAAVTVNDPDNLCLEYNDPPAQPMVPMTRIINPITEAERPLECKALLAVSLKSKITPRNPTAIPTSVLTLWKFSFQCGLSSTTNQIDATQPTQQPMNLAVIFRPKSRHPYR